MREAACARCASPLRAFESVPRNLSFLDLVDFGVIAFSVESVMNIVYTMDMQLTFATRRSECEALQQRIGPLDEEYARAVQV